MSTGCRLASVRGLSSLSWCVPSLLSTLLLCLWWVACKYAFISHSKGVFKGFYGVRVGLCCLGGLCGFCARVELGGLEACGVFAFLLSFFLLLCRLLSFCLSFSLFAPVVLWLSSFFALSLFVGCCFLFPFGICAKRKGAPCWCVLSSWVVGV